MGTVPKYIAYIIYAKSWAQYVDYNSIIIYSIYTNGI